MTRKFLSITALLVVLFFAPINVLGAIVINEVLYDPEGVDTAKEYIILYNNSDSDIDLTDWDLDPSSAPYYTLPSFILQSKSFVTIHINASGTNTNTDLYDNGSSNMSNTKGPVALFNSTTHSTTTIVDYIEYGEGGQTNESKAVSAGIWTAGDFIPDVDAGKVIKLKTDGADNNSSNDWEEADPTIQEEPSPSEEPETPTIEAPTGATGNQLPIPDAGDNIIGFIGQEINFDGTKSTDPDGNELAYSWNMGDGNLIEEPFFTYKYSYPGTYLITLMVYDGQYYVSDTITVEIQSQQITINEFIPNPEGEDQENEWIEIYNNSDSIIDISNWQLDDGDEGSKPFTFPQNTLIAPKNYLVFTRPITKIALNNDTDSIRLLLPGGIVFQEITYEKPKQGMSSARTNEGFVWNVPTPGMANITGPPTSIGGLEKETTYQGEIKKETTKESSQDYSWYYNEPEQQIKGGYIVQSEEQLTFPEDELAIVPSENKLTALVKSETKEFSNLKFWNQNNLNLILMIVIVILAALVIGLLITKFRKKIP